jgi:WD repeat-containing protein 76
MAPKTDDAVSTFEQRRRANLKTNAEILKDLSVTAAKVLPPKKIKVPAPKKRKVADGSVRQRPTREPRRVLPSRQSSRLAGLEADAEVLKRKLEVEAEAEAEKNKLKRMRRSGDLDLSQIVVEGKKWDGALEGLETLKSLSFRGAQPGVRTFKQEDEDTKDPSLKDLRSRMGGLKIYETFPVQGMLANRDAW